MSVVVVLVQEEALTDHIFDQLAHSIKLYLSLGCLLGEVGAFLIFDQSERQILQLDDPRLIIRGSKSFLFALSALARLG